MPAEVHIPYIDENVEHVGVSQLRKMNADFLRRNQKALLIQDNSSPVAVVLAYEQFLCMQRKIESLLETIELLSDDAEKELLITGLAQAKAGKVRSLPEIRRSLQEPS